MPDLVYESMPFRDLPGPWAPHIRRLLEDISALLTPAQREVFHFSELREEAARVVVGWRLLDPEESVPCDVHEAIELLIEQTARNVGQLELHSVPRPDFPFAWVRSKKPLPPPLDSPPAPEAGNDESISPPPGCSWPAPGLSRCVCPLAEIHGL